MKMTMDEAFDRFRELEGVAVAAVENDRRKIVEMLREFGESQNTYAKRDVLFEAAKLVEEME